MGGWVNGRMAGRAFINSAVDTRQGAKRSKQTSENVWLRSIDTETRRDAAAGQAVPHRVHCDGIMKSFNQLLLESTAWMDEARHSQAEPITSVIAYLHSSI